MAKVFILFIDDFSFRLEMGGEIVKVQQKSKTIKEEKYTEQSLVASTKIENLIFNVRGIQVMLDRDLAQLYGVSTGRLNEQVKRNIERFPLSFRFQLSEIERDEVIANCDNLKTLKFNPSLPYVFTEQGIAQLSSVLHTPTAIEVSIKIMNAFVNMRRFLIANAAVFQRLELLEQHQLTTDKKIDEIFNKIENHLPSSQGIFFDGQVFDAYSFISDLVRTATNKIILIDNYIDESVLTLLDKRGSGVSAEIYTHSPNAQLQLDIQRHDSQYTPIPIHVFTHSHDRFLCIDDTVYHIGASLKDLGKKWFAFSRMEINTESLLEKM